MRNYDRAGTVDIPAVLEEINAHTDAIILGKSVKVRTTRLMNFLHNGTDCVCCGIQGQYFAVERCDGHHWGWHLNLYAVDEARGEVLMTRDHAVLRSKGGADLVKNYKTMCLDCNNLRGSWFDSQDEFIEAYRDGTVHEKIEQKRAEASNFHTTNHNAHVIVYTKAKKAADKIEAEERRAKQRMEFLNSLPRRK